MGNFSISGDEWVPPRGKMVVFVSSTFTDTQGERNALKDVILAQLEAVVKLSGLSIEICFVDMRWGIVDQSTLDHRTWIECSRELERCRAESAGIFFLSLQAEK